jgi:hypothetical protein
VRFQIVFACLPALFAMLQYMVLDLKRFVPRKQLQEGLLWVAEQLPGVVEAADMTQVWTGRDNMT